jgi:hypothetical protein
LIVLLVPQIPRALLVVVHFLPGVAATIWCRVSATTPLIVSSSLVPIPILVFAVVLAAIPIFGVVTAVIARAHCLSTLIVKLFTARVRIRLTDPTIALMCRDIHGSVSSDRGIAATVLGGISAARYRPLAAKRFARKPGESV